MPSSKNNISVPKKLIDILDEMNLKEDTTNQMVIDKLDRLSRLIYDAGDDTQFVDTIMEDLIESPYKRITKLEIERCNNLYKQYKEIK